MTSTLNDLAELVSNQAKNELANHYAYKTLETNAENLGFLGLASFCASQAKGEIEHSDKIFSFLNNRGIKPPKNEIPLIVNNPVFEFLEIIQSIIFIEDKTTSEINKILAVASSSQDFLAFSFFLDLAKEQIEEEKIIGDILQRYIRRASTGDPASAIFDIDHWIGEVYGA
jgi:ferritin